MPLNNNNNQEKAIFSGNLNKKQPIIALKDVLTSNKSLSTINQLFEEKTNIVSFFSSKQEIKNFINFLVYKSINKISQEKAPGNREFGDIQTPLPLVRKVYQYLLKEDFKPELLIEPTFGIGNFIFPALDFFPSIKIIYGVELQQKNKWTLGLRSWLENWEKKQVQHSAKPKIYLHKDNIFTHEFLIEEFESPSSVLIIGNPPWVTAAELTSLGSKNIPKKSNFKALRGLNALTGKSNFDISESVLQLLLQQFSHKKGKIALLLKNTVIRNLLKHLPNTDYTISQLKALEINASREFGIACDASLFVGDLGVTTNDLVCEIRSLDKPKRIIKKVGWFKNNFVADVNQYQQCVSLEGKSKLIWRQGVKHDCAKVMELQLLENGLLKNRLHEKIDLERGLLYPLLKGADIGPFEICESQKRIILTQKRLNEETAKIKSLYPKTWEYLQTKRAFFAKRKSKIYN
ncbi:MAG: hypothetical protein GF308_19825, partial [Candidatus Heimdallarchaeota archaeon]|nr:hypothetical protein [Candidatus Heimdallarchaeota archaeon]